MAMYFRNCCSVLILSLIFLSTNLCSEVNDLPTKPEIKRVLENRTSNSENSNKKKIERRCKDEFELTIIEDGRMLGSAPYHRFMRSGINPDDDVDNFNSKHKKKKVTGNTGNRNESGQGKGVNKNKKGKRTRIENARDLLDLFPKAETITLYSCFNENKKISRALLSKIPGCYVLGLNKKGMMKLNKCVKGDVNKSNTFMKGINRIEYTTK